MKSLISKTLNNFKAQKVHFQNTILPAKHLRFCGQDFKNDEFFLNSARSEADRLVKYFGLSSQSRLLDIGCGSGRLAIGILNRIGNIQLYQGVDVDKKSIQWCNRYISKNRSNYKFLKLDVFNSRYNPTGKKINDGFQFPFENQKFDIAYLYSVFSHMIDEDIKLYLREFQRMLEHFGKIFLTAFVEENVPEMTINPANYRRTQWKGELHCVRFNKDFFQTLIKENGYQINHFEYEKETHGQSAYYLSKLN